MMFEDDTPLIGGRVDRLQDRSNFARVLVDDGIERNDVDNPIQPLPLGDGGSLRRSLPLLSVMQSEAEAREGLASACRYRKGCRRRRAAMQR